MTDTGEQRADRLGWERVPVLGRNSVFCFEARRMWPGWMIGVLLFVAPPVALVDYVAYHGTLLAINRIDPDSRVWPTFWLLQAGLPPELPRPAVFAYEASLWTGHWRAILAVIIRIAEWLVLVAARYVLPAHAAMSLVADRREGRLAAALTSGASVRQLLVGRLGALAMPFCVVRLVCAVSMEPLAMAAGAHPGLHVVWAIGVLTQLLAASTLGLLVGVLTRRRAVAGVVSVLIAGVGLPIVVGRLASIAANSLGGTSEAVALWLTVCSAAAYAVTFVVVWHAAKGALTRAAQ